MTVIRSLSIHIKVKQPTTHGQKHLINIKNNDLLAGKNMKILKIIIIRSEIFAQCLLISRKNEWQRIRVVISISSGYSRPLSASYTGGDEHSTSSE